MSGSNTFTGIVNIKHIRNGEVIGEETQHNLLTNAGRDQLFVQGYNKTGLESTGFIYIALSTETAAASTASTTLDGEIVGNGLARVQGAYTHSNGQSTATVANTFTSTATVDVTRSGLLDTSSAGTLGHEVKFASTKSLVADDQLAVTWTLTITGS